MSVWKATSASPTESASTRMAPLPVLVPLATGLDLVELHVWVSAQAASEGRKGGLTAGKGGTRGRGQRGGVFGGLGGIYMDHWTSGAFGDLEVAVMEDMSGKVGV